MPEYIEREPLVADLELLAKYENGERQQGILGVCETIRNRKAADVVEVRHGEWVKKEDGHYVCSECGRTRPYNKYTRTIKNWVCNYCHWCGTKMNGKDENDV